MYMNFSYSSLFRVMGSCDKILAHSHFDTKNSHRLVGNDMLTIHKKSFLIVHYPM